MVPFLGNPVHVYSVTNDSMYYNRHNSFLLLDAMYKFSYLLYFIYFLHKMTKLDNVRKLYKITEHEHRAK